MSTHSSININKTPVFIASLPEALKTSDRLYLDPDNNVLARWNGTIMQPVVANVFYATSIGDLPATASTGSLGVVNSNGKALLYTYVGSSWTETGDAVDLSSYQTKTDNSLTTDDKTVVGAINELDGEVATNTSNISTLQTSLAAKQDAAISVNIQGEAKTTIPEALTSLDTALTAVKTTADGAAKVDASNITPSTWKTVLGYQSASDVSTAITAGVTTDTYNDNLDTTNKTITGAINEINASIADKQDELTYYQENTSTGALTLGATTQASTPPSSVTVANADISIQLTSTTLNTVNASGGIFNREAVYTSTSQTGSINIPSNISSLAAYKVTFDTIAATGDTKSRTVFEYDATNNIWYREVIFGTGASITSTSGNTVNYDLGVAVSSANIVISML